jgi:Tol biopolymer transport system component
MTAFGRFDPFEQRVTGALEELAPATTPDYLDDIFGVTARTAQRPRWTFPERWLPMDITFDRRPVGPRTSPRPLLILALAGLILAALVVGYVGSRPRLPDPFGLADNGLVGYPADGALYVRDSLTGEARLLLDDAVSLDGPWFSPDGTRFLFLKADGAGSLWAADADGSNAVRLLDRPLIGDDATAVWSPDGRTLAVVRSEQGFATLSLVASDGSGVETTVDLAAMAPAEPSWRPPDGRELLFRGQSSGSMVDLYVVNADGTGLRALGIESERLPEWLGWDISGATWSLDGERIAYNAVETDPASGVEHFRVHLVNADGSGDVAVPGPADPDVMEAWPLYSPDGEWILVHRWTWSSSPGGGEGWLAVMPADGSAPARDIGPFIPGGEATGLIKTWTPDGTRILMRTENTRTVYSIDPVTGDYEVVPWTTHLPDVQRVGR